VAFILIFATAAADLVPPYLFKLAIDQYITPGVLSGLPLVLGVYVASLVISFICRYAQNYLMQKIGQDVMYDLRLAIFGRLQRQSLTYFDHNPVGRMISRLTSDVDALNDLLSSGVVSIIGDLVTLVGIAVVMLVLDWKLALVARGSSAGCGVPIASSASAWRGSMPSCRKTCRVCWSCNCSIARSGRPTSSIS